MMKECWFSRTPRRHTMMLNPVKLLAFTLFCSSTQGIFVQVESNTAICPSDVVVFWCSNGYPFLNWDIRTGSGQLKTFHFGDSSAVGTMTSHVLDSFPIVGHVTFNNGSFINATVTIMGASNFNGGTIACNGDNLNLTVPTTADLNFSSANFTVISIQQNIGTFNFMFTLSPNLVIMEEYVVTFSPPPPSGSDVITASSTTIISLENETQYNITIFFRACPERFNATLVFDPCIFHDPLIMDRKYILDLYGTWTIFQECTNSRIQFNTRCGSRGSWTTEMRCPAMSNITSTSYIYSVEDTTLNKATLHLGHEENSSKTASISSPILIIVVIAVTVIATAIAIIITSILLKMTLKKRKQKSSIEYQAQADISDMTYHQLSYKHIHHKPNTFPGSQLHATSTGICNQGEYSSLHHKKPVLPSIDEYATLSNIHHSVTVKQSAKDKSDFPEYSSLESKKTDAISEASNGYSSPSDLPQAKTKMLKYTDVDISGYNGPMEHDVIHIKTVNADINLRARPEDKTLNLNTLLIQLNSISKDFRLFGSVAGISPDILHKIVDSSAAPYDGLVEVCDAWLDKCHKEKTTPTWNAVADILSLIGQEKLSHDILQVYITGKLPIEVDMNSLNVRGEVHQFSPPPPIPPHIYEGNEETGSDVEMITVMTSRQSTASGDTTMEEPPPIPDKLHDIMPAKQNEESHQALLELPPMLPVKDQQRKPVPAKRKEKNNDDEVLP